MRESNSAYSISDLPNVLVIVVGLVTQDAAPAAPKWHSWIHDFDIQLLKTKVNIENVLRGDVSPGEVDVFYYAYLVSIGGSAQPLHFRTGALFIDQGR